MALGHSLTARTTLGRLRPGMGPAADTDEMDTGGVGAVLINGLDPRAMDPRAAARLRTKYASEVYALRNKVAALQKEIDQLRAQMVAVN